MPGPSSLTRMLAVLDLFTLERPVWTAEAICDACGCTRPTGYRYVKQLVEAGLLHRLGGGLYGLGARLIHLDYLIRRSDPVLRIAAPVMRTLAPASGCDAVLSGLYGDQILDTHREESGGEPLVLAYGRGRPRPPFQGGAPKVILANLPAARLRALWAAHEAEIRGLGLADDWDGFRAAMRTIRRRGHHVSRGELEPQLCSVAAPIRTADGAVIAALALVTTQDRFAALDVDALVARVIAAAAQIDAGLVALSARPSCAHLRQSTA